MPSRIRHTGADFTQAHSNSRTPARCAAALQRGLLASWARRLTAATIVGAVFQPQSGGARAATTLEGSSLAARRSDSPVAATSDARDGEPDSGAPSVASGGPVEITVQGELARNAGSKLREPLRDVPSTVNTVTAKTLRERASTDLVEALRNVAGVNPILQYGGFTYFTIRGFKDFVLVVDGVRDDRFYFVESAPTSNVSDVARIDVLKGPASALYGYGGIGGVIGLTRKAPSEELRYDAGVTVGGTLRGAGILRRSSLGVGGPIEGTGLSYRLDVGMGNDVDFRGARAESAKISGALEWRPSATHAFLVRGSFSRDRFDTDAGIPTDTNGRIPAGVALARRFNTAHDYLKSRSFDLSGAYTLQAAGFLELSARVNYTYNPYSYASAEALGLGPNDTVTRGWFFLQREWKPLYSTLEINATGRAFVEHRALAGYELGLLWAQNPQADLSNTELLPVPFAKGPDPQGGYGIARTSRLDWRQVTHSFYVHDTMTLLASLKLAVGARLDHWALTQKKRTLDPRSLAVTGTPSEVEREATAPTWRAGVVYQPAEWASVYGSFATAFRPAREVPADHRQLRPERGRQFEIGVRGEAARRSLQVSVAAYDIEKDDVVVDRGGGVYDQAGKQSSRGIEIDAGLSPIQGFAAQAGYSFTRARYETYLSPDGADYSGRIPANVPAHILTLWATYRMKNGLGYGLGGRVIGRSYADPANQVPLDLYALLDGALSYRFNAIELAVNVNNLLGAERYFVSSINGSQLTPGQPRTLLASLRVSR